MDLVTWYVYDVTRYVIKFFSIGISLIIKRLNGQANWIIILIAVKMYIPIAFQISQWNYCMVRINT